MKTQSVGQIMSRCIPFLVAVAVLAVPALAAEAPDYNESIAPILRKYCAACHNDDDREGGLSLASYEKVLQGGKRGAILTPGQGATSRLVRLITGEAKPIMPPDDSAKPKPEEISLLKAWIDSGAKGPAGTSPDPTTISVPRLPPASQVRPAITALAIEPNGELLAVGLPGKVELRKAADLALVHTFAGLRGPVAGLEFSRDGSLLVAAAGEPGLIGSATVWNVAERKLLATVSGHSDQLFDAAFSPNAALLATAGYDREIRLWELPSGKLRHTLAGHNAAVYDLDFHPQGKILASASADRMVKLWNVSSGARLDTLSQSLADVRTVAFDPRGERLAAAGADNRVRVWQLGPMGQEGTSPLALSRYAHEQPLSRLAWSRDGRTLATTAEDRLIKIWEGANLTLRATLPLQSDWVGGMVLTPDATAMIVGRLDGTLEKIALTQPHQGTAAIESVPLPEVAESVSYGPQPPIDKLAQIAETEPNDTPETALRLSAPAVATGRIDGASPDAGPDVDLYRFTAQAGEEWIVETNAARSGSPLDPKLEILDAAGVPVTRLLLRAVRDTELEFRGCTSDARGMRLKNYEEMLLNQYVFLGGEVVKLYRQRQGPDSDANLYPETGNRFSYFGTSPRAHALGTPGFVVVPYPAGAVLPDNGLPVIPLYFENDDDGMRQIGKDSRVHFRAPRDGDYVVRVRDVRGFGGENFNYRLIVRRPEPGFKVSLLGAAPTVAAGSGKGFTVKAERIDGFQGEISVAIHDVPPGFRVTSPIVIQSGLFEAKGTLVADMDAPAPTEANRANSKVLATASVAGAMVEQNAGSLGEIKRAEAGKIRLQLDADPARPREEPARIESLDADVPVVTIAPGTTVTCRLTMERRGFPGRMQFEVENLPHGVIVDNIGLNGILLPEGETERIIFLTAEPWVADTDRLFFASAKGEGDPTSRPMLLRVRRSPKP